MSGIGNVKKKKKQQQTKRDSPEAQRKTKSLYATYKDVDSPENSNGAQDGEDDNLSVETDPSIQYDPHNDSFIPKGQNSNGIQVRTKAGDHLYQKHSDDHHVFEGGGAWAGLRRSSKSGREDAENKETSINKKKKKKNKNLFHFFQKLPRKMGFTSGQSKSEDNDDDKDKDNNYHYTDNKMYDEYNAEEEKEELPTSQLPENVGYISSPGSTGNTPHRDIAPSTLSSSQFKDMDAATHGGRESPSLGAHSRAQTPQSVFSVASSSSEFINAPPGHVLSAEEATLFHTLLNTHEPVQQMQLIYQLRQVRGGIANGMSTPVNGYNSQLKPNYNPLLPPSVQGNSAASTPLNVPILTNESAGLPDSKNRRSTLATSAPTDSNTKNSSNIAMASPRASFLSSLFSSIDSGGKKKEAEKQKAEEEANLPPPSPTSSAISDASQSNATSIHDLLQQGQSAGKYAQTLREILRKVNKDDSSMQRETLEEVLRLGQSIASQEANPTDKRGNSVSPPPGRRAVHANKMTRNANIPKPPTSQSTNTSPNNHRTSLNGSVMTDTNRVRRSVSPQKETFDTSPTAKDGPLNVRSAIRRRESSPASGFRRPSAINTQRASMAAPFMRGTPVSKPTTNTSGGIALSPSDRLTEAASQGGRTPGIANERRRSVPGMAPSANANKKTNKKVFGHAL